MHAQNKTVFLAVRNEGTTAVVVPTMLYTATCGADSHPPPHKCN